MKYHCETCKDTGTQEFSERGTVSSCECSCRTWNKKNIEKNRKRLEKLRKSAIAKLTDEEIDALDLNWMKNENL